SVLAQRGAYVVAVIRFVHDSRLHRACFGHRIKNLLHHGGIVLLASCQNESEGRVLVCRSEVQLGAEPAPTTAESLRFLTPFFVHAPAACWCARMIVL